MFYEVGYNQYNVGDFNGLFYDSLHAEVDAMTKLKPNRKGKLKKINLFVFRINNFGDFRNSKCCDNCIKSIFKISQKKNYKVNNIYFTESENNIVKYDMNKTNCCIKCT